MAIEQHATRLASSQEVILPARVLFALDSLDPSEQEAVRAALHDLAQGDSADRRLRRLAGDEPIYIVRAAPQVRLFVRLVSQAPVEVLDLVRPETLEKMFGVADPVPDHG